MSREYKVFQQMEFHRDHHGVIRGEADAGARSLLETITRGRGDEVVAAGFGFQILFPNTDARAVAMMVARQAAVYVLDDRVHWPNATGLAASQDWQWERMVSAARSLRTDTFWDLMPDEPTPESGSPVQRVGVSCDAPDDVLAALGFESADRFLIQLVFQSDHLLSAVAFYAVSGTRHVVAVVANGRVFTNFGRLSDAADVRAVKRFARKESVRWT